ncbi:stealth family protein [Pediococcus pentosaceus]|uniref:stealth family protein n=1 Tax=Pediococcus pentosaceus TaxID=1255 RepID=UPI00398B2EDB
MNDIDFVVTWVDDSDPKWQLKRSKYISENRTLMNNEVRYRDYGTLKYWFRAVEKYAPWVHKIFVITDDQFPSWLDETNDKIVFVNHKDYIDEQYLPTFNSDVIELNIANIQGLSEKFVLFNDDVFLNDFVNEEDFFKNGLPVDVGAFQPTIPTSEFTHVVLNDLLLINKWFNKHDVLKKNKRKLYSKNYGLKRLISAATCLPFNKIIGFYDSHITTPYLKSNYEKVVLKAKANVEQTNKNKFRKNNDINHWLIRYFNYCEGLYIPQKKGFGEYYELNNIKEFCEDIEQSKHKVICVNDVDNDKAAEGRQVLNKLLDKKFHQKSNFEV